MAFAPGLISTSPHDIIKIYKNDNLRIKRMLKRSIPTLICFEVLPLLCSTSQNVIIDKNNIIPEFVGIHYLWSKTLYLAFVPKTFGY